MCRIGLWDQACSFLWGGVGPGSCCPPGGNDCPSSFSVTLTADRWRATPSQNSTTIAPPGLQDGVGKSPKTLGSLGWGWPEIHERI